METRCRICLHYIIPEIGAGPIRVVIRVLRAIVGRYTTTRRPSSRTRVHRPRLHSKYINEFTMRALIPNGPTNRSSSRNALSFRAFALAVVRRYDGFLDAKAGDREKRVSRWKLIGEIGCFVLGPQFPDWAWINISSVEATWKIRIGRGKRGCVLIWTDFGDISDILNAN